MKISIEKHNPSERIKLLMKRVQQIAQWVCLSVVFSNCRGDNPLWDEKGTGNPDIPSIEYSQYVTVQNRSFFLKGKRWFPYGGSLYPTGKESNYHQKNCRRYMDEILEKAVSAKFTTVRIVDYINGVTSDPYDAHIWANVDYVIKRADEKGMKVLLDLSTYRNFLKEKKMPYDMDDWRAFLLFVGNRYKDNPAVWLYSLAGEADAPYPEGQLPPYHPTSTELIAFYREASNLLHSVAPHQLISCGGFLQLEWNSGIKWREIFALPHIHVPAVHLYGNMIGVFRTVADHCKQVLNKPLYMEEFGMERTNSIGDEEISAHYNYIITLCKLHEAAGIGFWNLGVQTLPPTYDVNENLPKTWELLKRNSPL